MLLLKDTFSTWNLVNWKELKIIFNDDYVRLMPIFLILQITFFHLPLPHAPNPTAKQTIEKFYKEKNRNYLHKVMHKGQENREIFYPSAFLTDNIKHFQKFPWL